MTTDVDRQNNLTRKPEAGNVIQVTEDESIGEVTLRNGTKHDPGLVNGAMLALNGFCSHRPNLFVALLELARGEKSSAPIDVLRELKRAGLVTQAGSVRPLFRDVLLSAYRETPEGMVLTSPFGPQSESEADMVRTALAETEKNVRRFVREYGLDQKPDDGSFGR